jgi:hypothetical protein
MVVDALQSAFRDGVAVAGGVIYLGAGVKGPDCDTRKNAPYAVVKSEEGQGVI